MNNIDYIINAQLDRDAQITAAFFMDGASSKLQEAAEGWGVLEFTYALTNEAMFAAEISWAAFEQVGDFKGVFDYEVSSPYGWWFTKYVLDFKEMPTKLQCQAELIRLTLEFLRRDINEAEMARLTETLRQYTYAHQVGMTEYA